jgi:hypothetical protein
VHSSKNELSGPVFVNIVIFIKWPLLGHCKKYEDILGPRENCKFSKWGNVTTWLITQKLVELGLSG